MDNMLIYLVLQIYWENHNSVAIEKVQGEIVRGEKREMGERGKIPK